MMLDLHRNLLLGLAALCFSFAAIFTVVGYELCYGTSLCYEISTVFGIYNYASELIIISLAVGVAASYSLLRKVNSVSWIVFTFLWVPVVLALSMKFGGDTNGWIPTSPSSSYIAIFLSLVYLGVSSILLRGKSLQ
jgi:hypothetical protein